MQLKKVQEGCICNEKVSGRLHLQLEKVQEGFRIWKIQEVKRDSVYDLSKHRGLLDEIRKFQRIHLLNKSVR